MYYYNNMQPNGASILSSFIGADYSEIGYFWRSTNSMSIRASHGIVYIVDPLISKVTNSREVLCNHVYNNRNPHHRIFVPPDSVHVYRWPR